MPADPLLDTDAGRLFLERASEAKPDFALTAHEQEATGELLDKLEGVPISIERAARMMDTLSPAIVLDWLNQKLEPNRVPSRATNAEKFKGMLRRGAQKVSEQVEELPKTLAVNLGNLLQGVANVATDRRDETEATELGRESLRLSQQSGNELGIAAALRQLARARWQQGDRKSAVAMLSVAVQLYRSHNAEEFAETQRELDRLREQLAQHEGVLPVIPSVEGAIDLAMRD